MPARRSLGVNFSSIRHVLAGRSVRRRVQLARSAPRIDRAVMELLDRAAVSYGLVLTKTDELGPAEVQAALTSSMAEARKHTAALEEIHATSSRDGTGMPELRQSIAGLAS